MLAVTIQYPDHPGEPCFVSVQQVLPNGTINLAPTEPCAPQLFANVPLNDFIPPRRPAGLVAVGGGQQQLVHSAARRRGLLSEFA